MTQPFDRFLTIIFLVMRIFSSVAFAVFYSSLLLYMIGAQHLSSQTAIFVTGGFLALNYTLPLLGGLISGKLISHKTSFGIGTLLQSIASLLLYLYPMYFYWSLGLFLAGCLGTSTSMNMLITQAFSQSHKTREKAFLYNYAGMNLGYFAGYTLAGYFELNNNYATLFFITAILSLLALLTTLVFWRKLETIQSPEIKKRRAIWLTTAIFVIAILLVKFAFAYAALINIGIITIWGLLFVLIVLKQCFNRNTIVRNKMWVFLILVLAATVFWSIYLMAPLGLMVFVKYNVIKLIGGFPIAPQWLQDINTFLIVFGSPLLVYVFDRLHQRGIEISIATKFSISLAMMALGFLVLPIGISFANSAGLTSIWWVVLSYILQSIGELFIGPIGWAVVGQLVEQKSQSLMTGFWIMILGVAGSIASLCSEGLTNVANLQHPLLTNAHYSDTFMYLGAIGVVVALMLFIAGKFIRTILPH